MGRIEEPVEKYKLPCEEELVLSDDCVVEFKGDRIIVETYRTKLEIDLNKKEATLFEIKRI